ncbi:LysR family transcriptional regulator [Kineosporia sp. NBRC 101677]|uniref:LysR family transcriptional regulator n=1 Tax=Kineosporia sp. NBRC 101677 TaxID=3032197 RepID=UPI0024A33D60|nr:LysR family transcriptional regulator [Kineosporia sp. NBRC 101677]GLY18904.1 LysR family transcriptional regulator [Kineosporia sp. NBRC 101677]
MTLARLDLNLLVALDALLRRRSVTRAAAEMGLSQPALSASLGRLRRHFDDDLLTRVGNEYRLTPLALQLEPLVRVALAGAEQVFEARSGFDPATSSREFSLLISDYAVTVLGDTIAGILAAEAPEARLRLAGNVPSAVDHADRSLLMTDLLIMPHGFLTGMPHTDLYRDEWVCLIASGAAAAQNGLSADDLRELPWVMSYHGPTASTPAARQMRMLGIEPRVQVITESFLTVPALVAGTDRVALLQRRLVDLLPLNAGVRAVPCPFEVSPLIEAMWWHPVHDEDPEHQYLRDVVRRAVDLAVTPD